MQREVDYLDASFFALFVGVFENSCERISVKCKDKGLQVICKHITFVSMNKILKKISKTLLLIGIVGAFTACDTLNEVAKTVYEGATTVPTNTEMSTGIKEALTNGVRFAVNTLGEEGGYYNDPLVKIPFPQEAEFAAKALRDIGLGKLVDDFERLLNEGAEEGAKEAFTIFAGAVKSMTLTDVRNILLGDEHAATNYFRAKTSEQLYQTFSPKVEDALDKVNATQVWTDLTSKYNSIPFTQKKIETDLVRYATDKAMEGLFLKISVEEEKIRENVAARTSDLLKKVFGYAEREKAGQG